MNKQASPVKSLDAFAKKLSQNGFQNAKVLAKKRMIGNAGTGSFFLDLIGGNKIKNSNAIKKMQTKLTDVDMKAGGAAYDFFNNRKSKRINNMKNMFVNEHIFDKGKNSFGSTDAVKIKSTGLLNPITKSRDKILPLVGGMTVANAITPKEPEDQSSRGE